MTLVGVELPLWKKDLILGGGGGYWPSLTLRESNNGTLSALEICVEIFLPG